MYRNVETYWSICLQTIKSVSLRNISQYPSVSLARHIQTHLKVKHHESHVINNDETYCSSGSKSSFTAGMHLKSNARWFLEETQCLYDCCMSFISFSLAVIFIIKLHKFVRFSTGCFVLLQCIKLSSFHI